MLSRSNPTASPSARTRALLLASIAALVVTSFDAHAAPAAAQPSTATAKQSAAVSGAEFGSRKRGRRGNNAAGLAMMGLMVGAIGGVIAAQQRREAYEAAYARPVYGAPYGYAQPYAYHQPHAYQQPYARQQQPRVYHQPYAGQKPHGYVFTNGVMHWEGQPLNVPAPPAAQ